jgi:hypothetical protein
VGRPVQTRRGSASSWAELALPANGRCDLLQAPLVQRANLFLLTIYSMNRPHHPTNTSHQPCIPQQSRDSTASHALAPPQAQRGAEVESDAGSNRVQSHKANTCMGTIRLRLLLKKASKAAERATKGTKGKGASQRVAASSTWVGTLLMAMLFLFLVVGGMCLNGATTTVGCEVLVASNASASVVHDMESVALPQRARQEEPESVRAREQSGSSRFIRAWSVDDMLEASIMSNMGLLTAFSSLTATSYNMARRDSMTMRRASLRPNRRPHAIASSSVRLVVRRLLIGLGVGVPRVTPFNSMPVGGGGSDEDGLMSLETATSEESRALSATLDGAGEEADGHAESKGAL